MSTAVTPQEAEERLLHILEIYPAISPSMMNISMNSIDSRVWKPVLDQMISDNKIRSKAVYSLTPSGRTQSYTIYFNPKFDYDDYLHNTASIKSPMIDLSASTIALEKDSDLEDGDDNDDNDSDEETTSETAA